MKAAEQRAAAKAAGKDARGLHSGASGTYKHAMTESLARAEFDKQLPYRREYRVRKHESEGRKHKVIKVTKLSSTKAMIQECRAAEKGKKRKL